MKQKLNRFLSLALALTLLLGMLPTTAWAGDTSDFESFFTQLQGVAEVTNDADYPFEVDTTEDAPGDGPWLKSTNKQHSSASTITLTFTSPAILSFDWKVSSEEKWDGMLVQQASGESTKTLYTFSSSAPGCSGEANGTAAVHADAGDIVTIAYKKDSSGSSGKDTLWLKNFTYEEPAAITLYANYNDAEPSTAVQAAFTSSVTLKANPFTREGYAFKGWATEANGGVAYADGATVETPVSIDLYAVWAPLYTASFTVAPANATFGLYQDAGYEGILSPVSGGTHAYLLEAGDYYWRASAFGYEDASGTVTVSTQDVDTPVSLVALESHAVTFQYAGGTDPVANGSIRITTGEQVMAARQGSEGMVFDLPLNYTYTYTFTSRNYARQTGTIDLTEGQAQETIDLPLSPKTAWEGAEDLEAVTPGGNVYTIENGAQLAWFAQQVNSGALSSANAVLAGDIDLGDELWTPIGSSSKPYAGSFDGTGHTIRGLRVEGSSYLGLFGYSSGTVTGVTIEGAISGTGSYVGGLVGYNKGTISKCINKAAVTTTGSNSSYSTGLVGGITAFSDSSTQIDNCANFGTVTAPNGYGAGGIVGNAYGNYSTKAVIKNVYNAGAVSAINWAGGIIGISSYADVQNAYNRGAVTGSYTYLGELVGNVYYSTGISVSNLFYLSGGKNAAGNGTVTAQAVDGQEAMTAALVGKIGAFIADTQPPVNEGWPILGFQDPTATYNLTLTVSPADAEVTVSKDSTPLPAPQPIVEQGVATYIYPDMSGTYTYEVSRDDHAAQAGTVHVSGENESRLLALAANTYTLDIRVTPADAAVVLRTSTGAVVTNPAAVEGQYTYTLPSGSYTLNVSKFGYVAQEQTIVIDKAPAQQNVALAAAQSTAASFDITYSDQPAVSPTPIIRVLYGERVIEAEGNGSYILPTGSYTYSIRAKGYAAIKDGILTVPENPPATTGVSITMTPSAAWDGEEVEQPDEGNGTAAQPYQIENGAQLKWIADQINTSTSKRELYAELTTDINLGDQPWTPIGKDSTYYFAGSFDGKGYTIRGLDIDMTDRGNVGLFGYVKGSSSSKLATIKNLTVEGSVSGGSQSSGYVGGVVGYSSYLTLENVHNKADVTNNQGSKWIGGVVAALNNGGSIKNCSNQGKITAKNSEEVGGIVGYIYIFSSSTPYVTQSFNSGAVEGKKYVGGVVGKLDTPVADVYNTGTVTGTEIVGGIAGKQGGKIANAYTTGTVSGSQKTFASFGEAASSSATRTNIYYLESLTADVNATPQTAAGLRGIFSTLGTNWKDNTEGGTNQQYPLLSWQQVVPPEVQPGQPLDTPSVQWQKENPQANPSIILPVALWAGVENAAAYELRLLLPKTEGGYQRIASIEVAANGQGSQQYDFADAFESGMLDGQGLSKGRYRLQIVAKSATGTEYADSSASAPSTDAYAYINLAPATGFAWQGETAAWQPVELAAAYTVTVYRLPAAEGGDLQFIYSDTVEEAALNCTGLFSPGGRYVFTVIALAQEGVDGLLPSDFDDQDGQYTELDYWLECGYASYSGLSNANGHEAGVYSPDPAPEKPDQWIEITSAQQLADLANVEDKLSADGQTNEQTIAWSKNYKLAANIDFSVLPPSYSNKTKTIGNLNHPFTGYFDGNGYEITGLTLSNRDSGLFAYIGTTGIVDGVTIRNANVLFSDNAGVLAYANYGVIKNCAVINTNISADTGAVLGGMLSRNYGIVEDSYVLGGSLTSNTDTANGHAGFAGSNEQGGIIRRCYSTMEIKTNSKYAGGFVGLCYGGEISNSFALGNVTAREHSGGFAGSVVYSGNTFTNCYASNRVTVEVEGTAYGFVSIRTPESAFAGMLEKDRENFKNALFNSDLTATDASPALVTGKTAAQLKGADTLALLGGENWEQNPEKNNGLPYLKTVPAPISLDVQEITVQIMMATYSRETYAFVKQGEPVTVTVSGKGNTRVIDALDAAVAQGKLTYSYSTSIEFGRYIQSINGYGVDAPDGWMFTVNDSLSDLSASIASVADGAKILWYEGTTENHFSAPTWDEVLTGRPTVWIDIDTPQKLINLTYAGTDLSKNYRLTTPIDLTELSSFYGIGDESNPFTGVFDGQGYTITGLKMNYPAESGIGLFRVLEGGTVKNVRLNAPVISGSSNVGALVGLSKAALNTDQPDQSRAGLIGNCHVIGGTVNGVANVGGLVGQNGGVYDYKTGFSKYSSINQSSSSAEVRAVGSGSSVFGAGGLVGKSEGYITSSHASGAVSGNRGVGGLVGDSTGEIYDSYASGNVTGVGTVGGFVGYSSGKVKRCYSLGHVTGQEKTGGFAGALNGAEQIISCGTVTVLPAGSGSSGRLAGELNGSMTGVANMITVKEVYANCVPDAASLKVIGNASAYLGETNEAGLAAMQLTTLTAVADKLYAMFGVNLPVESLTEEAEKYAETVSLPAETQPQAPISLLKPGQTAGADIAVTFDLQGSPWLTAEDGVLRLKTQNNTVGAVSIPIQMILSNQSGSYRKDVTIILLPQAGQADRLMQGIAAGYVEQSNEWVILDMAAYRSLYPDTALVTGPEALQRYINYAIGTVADHTKGSSTAARTYAKAEIILRSIGGDTTTLYPANSNTAISNPGKLKALKLNTLDVYDAPWVLLANLQGSLKLSGAQIQSLIKIIGDAQSESGVYAYTWGGETYTDPDTTASVITALSAHYSTNADAKRVVDKAIAGLSVLQGQNGSFGDPNSDAMIVIALAAMGIDPDGDPRFVKNGVSLLTGLLSYANDTLDGFLYYGEPNALATEQGFRALIAAEQLRQQQRAFNLYNFSSKQTAALRATGDSSVQPPEEPPEDGDPIQVTFSLKAIEGYWIQDQSIQLTEGSTVYHAFVKALENGFTHVGAEEGYVRSITNRTAGITLAEFGKGKDSGWLYQVNSVQPKVGLTYYVLENGDVIEWFYSADYTKEEGSEPWSGGGGGAPETGDQDAASGVISAIDAIGPVTKDSGAQIKAARSAYGKLTEAQKKLVTNYSTLVAAEEAYARLPDAPAPQQSFDDVKKNDWYYEAVQFAYENGLFEGVAENQFDPAGQMTRAMLVTVLYRHAGKPAASGENGFTDVAGGTWYADAVSWAAACGLISR